MLGSAAGRALAGNRTRRQPRLYERARAASHDAITELDVEATGTTWRDDTVSLRWAILHTIEEPVRHAGHAEFMRECLDNTTGYLPVKNLPY